MDEDEIRDKLHASGLRGFGVAPACFKAFVEEMKGKQYGPEPTLNAWHWFRSGWMAARARLE